MRLQLCVRLARSVQETPANFTAMWLVVESNIESVAADGGLPQPPALCSFPWMRFGRSRFERQDFG
jgi:hypothetical protein